MTTQDLILNVISSAVVSGALAGVIVWLSREWISARLKASIQHEYDQKLEAHKARLKSENDIALLETKNRMEQQLTLFEATRTSFAEGQKAAIERKLDSIEKLWDEILTLDERLPSTFMFIDIVPASTYKNTLLKNKTFRTLAEEFSEEEIAKCLSDRDEPVGKVRPYVGEYLWSIFFSYRALMGQISFLLHQSLKEPDSIEWHRDKGVCQILEVVLTSEERDEFKTVDICKISWLKRLLQSKILAASQKIISGEELGTESLKQAESILRRVAATSINRSESLL